MLDSPIAEGSSYVPAIFGLAGSLIGGFIAGTVSLLVARQARKADQGAWIRDNRREIYDRLLTYSERLLHACEAYNDAHSQIGARRAIERDDGAVEVWKNETWPRMTVQG